MEKQDNCEQSIDTFKHKYKTLKEKYNLPELKQLDEEFDIISKIECNAEIILREIRKAIIVKFASVLNFIELLLNPTSGSMFHMYLVKGVNGIEKDVRELFTILGEIEIDSIELEINYNENKEAEFIKDKFELWQKIKPKLEKITASLKLNWKSTAIKKERSYFG